MNPAKVRNASRTLGRRSVIRSAPRAVASSGLAHWRAVCPRIAEARLAEAAPRNPDRAEERFVVRRIRDEPQVCEQVLHLPPLVEADGADQPVGHAGPAERLFQRAALRVGAVEDRHLGVAPVAGGAPALQLAHHPLGLVALVGGSEQGDHLAAAAAAW